VALFKKLLGRAQLDLHVVVFNAPVQLHSLHFAHRRLTVARRLLQNAAVLVHGHDATDWQSVGVAPNLLYYIAQ
jgi:hypothetical protein